MRWLALLALLAACGGSGPTTTNPGTGNPDAGDPDAGYPRAVTVEWSADAETTGDTTTAVSAGTPVQWHNADGTSHSIDLVGPQFLASTGPMPAGATSAPQSLPAGTYRYRCSIHPGVEGTLIVQ